MQTTATLEKMEWKGGKIQLWLFIGTESTPPTLKAFQMKWHNTTQQYHLFWWMVNLLAVLSWFESYLTDGWEEQYIGAL